DSGAPRPAGSVAASTDDRTMPDMIRGRPGRSAGRRIPPGGPGNCRPRPKDAGEVPPSSERPADGTPERPGRGDDPPRQRFGRVVGDRVAVAVGDPRAGTPRDEVARGDVPFPGWPKGEHRVKAALRDKA